MSEWMIEQYTVERIKPHKQFAVWAITGNTMYPICYIQKPKWMSEADYEKVTKYIRFDAPNNLLAEIERTGGTNE